LPGTSGELLQVAAVEMLMFSAMVGLALLFSKATWRQMLMNWKQGWTTLAYGAFYSVVLRLGIALLTLLLLAPILLNSKDTKAIEEFRPKTENLIDAKALEDPIYLALTLTVISFVVAGFREELWRAGVLAGLRGAAPEFFSTRKGQYAAAVIAAVIFGLGHLPQGYGGAIMTGALGLGLGIIMVRHQSIWEAALAHGFFNATSFALIFIMLKYFPDKFPGLPAGFIFQKLILL
jgi:membrane protease YdiL (CAAX protease family)